MGSYLETSAVQYYLKSHKYIPILLIHKLKVEINSVINHLISLFYQLAYPSTREERLQHCKHYNNTFTLSTLE